MFDKVNYATINDVDTNKVKQLIGSILANGWVGSPILYHRTIGLITGSHRATALEKIEEMYYNEELTHEQLKRIEEISDSGIYAYEVTSMVDNWLEGNSVSDIQYDYLIAIFEGTEVEVWKDDIVEWD